MKYLECDEIKYLQIDHNSTCNLRCAQCARTHNGDTHPDLPMLELSVDSYKKFFDEAKNIETIMWCGNYGEVIVSKTFFECLKYTIDNTKAKIIITSNGSARDVKWWKEIALLLKNRGKVNFSIDGLEDTNHLYRVNANWSKIIQNASAFIEAGGKARWDYLIFSHNEHQVEDALTLARKLKFKQFQIKLTNRFINDEQYKNKTQTIDDKQFGSLKIPKNKNYQGSGKDQNQQIIEKYGNWTNYINTTPIKCKWKPNGQIFLDFETRVWPCTWTASGYYHYGNNTQKHQAEQIFELYGKDFNRLDTYSLYDILSNKYFAKEFCNSWSGSTEDKVPKLFACGRTCGTDYEFSSVYGNNKQLITL